MKEFVAMAEDPLTEMLIHVKRSKPAELLIRKQLPHPVWTGSTRRLLGSSCHREAASVDFIQLNVNNSQTSTSGHPNNLLYRIVLLVFMTDGVIESFLY